MEHQPTQQEQAWIDELLERYEFDYVPIRLTDTMLDKSIIDAGASLRALLRQSGLVDFSAIPPTGAGDGLRVQLPVATAAGLEHRPTSFYRPVTKAGDPRFWIYGLKGSAHPGDLLLIAFSGATVVAFLASVGLDALRGALDQLFPLRRDELTEVLQAIERIRGKVEAIGRSGWVRTRRSGDTGVGFTFESLLDVAANVRQGADLDGVELKAHRSGAGSRSDPLITLFSKTPTWGSVAKTKGLVTSFGYYDEVRERQALYCSIGCSQNSLGWSLVVEAEANRVSVCHDHEPKLYYTFPVLQKRLAEKHSHTLFVSAKARGEGREEEFLYERVVYCSQPSFARFADLIEANQVCLDFTAHLEPNGRGRDHGYLWRIRESRIPELFAYRKEILRAAVS